MNNMRCFVIRQFHQRIDSNNLQLSFSTNSNQTSLMLSKIFDEWEQKNPSNILQVNNSMDLSKVIMDRMTIRELTSFILTHRKSMQLMSLNRSNPMETKGLQMMRIRRDDKYLSNWLLMTIYNTKETASFPKNLNIAPAKEDIELKTNLLQKLCETRRFFSKSEFQYKPKIEENEHSVLYDGAQLVINFHRGLPRETLVNLVSFLESLCNEEFDNISMQKKLIRVLDFKEVFIKQLTNFLGIPQVADRFLIHLDSKKAYFQQRLLDVHQYIEKLILLNQSESNESMPELKSDSQGDLEKIRRATIKSSTAFRFRVDFKCHSKESYKSEHNPNPYILCFQNLPDDLDESTLRTALRIIGAPNKIRLCLEPEIGTDKSDQLLRDTFISRDFEMENDEISYDDDIESREDIFDDVASELKARQKIRFPTDSSNPMPRNPLSTLASISLVKLKDQSKKPIKKVLEVQLTRSMAFVEFTDEGVYKRYLRDDLRILGLLVGGRLCTIDTCDEFKSFYIELLTVLNVEYVRMFLEPLLSEINLKLEEIPSNILPMRPVFVLVSFDDFHTALRAYDKINLHITSMQLPLKLSWIKTTWHDLVEEKTGKYTNNKALSTFCKTLLIQNR